MGTSLIQAMRADSPSALWVLDERSGSVVYDVSGNARNMVYQGSPSQAVAPVLPGDFPVWNPTLNGADFASMNPLPSWFAPGAGDFLYTCWFKGTSVNQSAGSFEGLLNADINDTGNGIAIYIVDTWVGADTGTLRVWYAGSVLQSTQAQQGYSIHNGNAHLVWVEKRSGTVSIYMDGVFLTSGVRGTPTMGAVDGFYLARSYTQGNLYGLNNPISYVGLWTQTTIPAVSRQTAYMAEARRAGVTIG